MHYQTVCNFVMRVCVCARHMSKKRKTFGPFLDTDGFYSPESRTTVGLEDAVLRATLHTLNITKVKVIEITQMMKAQKNLEFDAIDTCTKRP